MSFHFSFADSDELELEPEPQTADEGLAQAGSNVAAGGTEPADPSAGHASLRQPPPKEWHLADLLSTLPPYLSYSPIAISLDAPSSSSPFKFHLARRDLFDARFQMLHDGDQGQEPERNPDHETAQHGLAKCLDSLTLQPASSAVGADSDLVPGVYEGGLKTWECAADLIAEIDARARAEGSHRLVLEGKRIVELGCGTALPSMFILSQLLSPSEGSSGVKSNAQTTEIHLADFNPEVLRLVTLPNLILTWYLFSPAAAPFRAAEQQLAGAEAGAPKQPHPHPHLPPPPSPDTPGELELSPELLAAFEADLAQSEGEVQVRARAPIRLRFFSGPWSAGLLDAMKGRGGGRGGGREGEKAGEDSAPYAYDYDYDYDVVLTSETVYSLDTLPALADMLYGACAARRPGTLPSDAAAGSAPRTSASALAARSAAAAGPLCLVAAKVLYFGVGGGVHSFVQAIERGAGPAAAAAAAPNEDGDGGGTARATGSRPAGSARVVREIKAGVGRAVLEVCWP